MKEHKRLSLGHKKNDSYFIKDEKYDIIFFKPIYDELKITEEECLFIKKI